MRFSAQKHRNNGAIGKGAKHLYHGIDKPFGGMKVEAKTYLKEARKIDSLIENKLAERERWRAIAMSTTQQMGGERVQSSSNPQRMADAITKYVGIENEIDRLVDRFVDKKREIISTIEKLSQKEYDLLHKVYIQYYTLDEYAAKKGKSYSWVTTVHGRALKKLQTILNEREKACGN